MNTPDLRTLDEAASELRVPKASLRTAAEKHGLLVLMGRAIRIDRNDYGRLVKKCQDQARAQGSTSTQAARNGSSSTPDNDTAQRAAQTAQKLKKSSRRTSPQRDGQVLQMSRKT